jgi:glycosyltransferase involved in cell wall biosynthesis
VKRGLSSSVKRQEPVYGGNQFDLMGRATKRIVHVLPWANGLGGLQSCIRYHQAHDRSQGFANGTVALFDHESASDGCESVNAVGRESVERARRSFRSIAQKYPASVWVYHDGWGLPWWADLDGAQTRILFLHTEVPHLDRLLRQFGTRVDGFITINRSVAARVEQVCPDFPRDRIFSIPYFVEGPEARGIPGRRPWIIGYAGRLAEPQKRVSRLGSLVACLESAGIDFELEILGTGPEETALRDQFKTNSRVKFLGYLQGEAYWDVIRCWDNIVLVSDYEGMPRTVLEGMSVGVVPIYPAFSPAAAELLGGLGDVGLYPPGDMRAAAALIVAQVRQLPQVTKDARFLAIEQMKAHRPENYDAAFYGAVRQICAQPKRSVERKPSWWETVLPMRLHTRLFPSRF